MEPAVIFDFFGVFCSSIATDWYKKNISVDPEDLKAFQALCTLSDYGKLSRDDFNKKVSSITGKPISEIIDGMERETSINTSLVAYTKKLRDKGHRIACLSNGTQEWTLRVITDHGLRDLFDVVVLSGDLGIVKPSPEIYTHTLESLELSPNQAVFVDDRQANVDAAVALGMHGLLFNDTETFIHEFERLKP